MYSYQLRRKHTWLSVCEHCQARPAIQVWYQQNFTTQLSCTDPCVLTLPLLGQNFCFTKHCNKTSVEHIIYAKHMQYTHRTKSELFKQKLCPQGHLVTVVSSIVIKQTTAGGNKPGRNISAPLNFCQRLWITSVADKASGFYWCQLHHSNTCARKMVSCHLTLYFAPSSMTPYTSNPQYARKQKAQKVIEKLLRMIGIKLSLLCIKGKSEHP